MRTTNFIALCILLLSMQPSAAPSASETLPGVTFKASPDILRECDGAAVVKLTCDATVSGDKTAKIFVLDRYGAEQIFTFAGASGSIDTGPWVTSGTTFILRDEN